MAGLDEGAPAADGLGWRAKLLEWLLIYALGLATLAFPVIGFQAITWTHYVWLSSLVLFYGLLLIATFARKLPWLLRALGLLTGLGAVAVLGFYRVGFQVGPGLGSALIVVLSGLLLGRVAMAATFTLTLTAILSLGAYHSYTHGASLAPNINDPTRFSNWSRVATSYALFCGVLAAAVSFVVDHIERLLAQKTEALERVRAESLLKQEAEHALDDAQRTIVQMQKLEALGRLAGGVAHDFNNVLVVILGWADLLRSKLDDPGELRRGLDEIVTASNHAAVLTRQLLSFGRRGVWVPRSLAPATLFSDVESMLRRVLPENIHLTLSAHAELPAIFADPNQMQQVLLNMCMNARDAMPLGGELALRAERVGSPADAKRGEHPPGEWVAITVRDNGVGMDGDTMARAFEPFFTTKGEHGTGLGLSTVYGIVGHCGGHVLVESELGKGTLFTLLLPPCAAEDQRPSQPAQRFAAAPISTILVAEDEAAVRGLMVTALRAAGHTVLAAENGNAALEIARRYRGKIDLLCTDGVMPGTSSATLIADFRTLFPAANVLVCSGHCEELALQRLSRNELRYLQKPFTVTALRQGVAEALEPHSARPAQLAHSR